MEFSRGSRIRIMPDVHAGKGCTIGTTMTIVDKVVPSIVGMDIDCGMYTVKLGKLDLDYEKLDRICHWIPSGMDTWEEETEVFNIDELKCRNYLVRTGRLKKSLGTLGGGNLFIEIDEGQNGTKISLSTPVAGTWENKWQKSTNKKQ